jgi:hypothetical protein
MMKTNWTDRWVVSHCVDAASHEMGVGVTVILDLSSGLYYLLDTVGTCVWNLLQEHPCTIEELLNNVADTHEIEPERCRPDILAFVRELAMAGLVEVDRMKPR